jgi:hypothetical protein
VAFSYDVNPDAYGALKFTLGTGGASFAYVNSAGTSVDSGYIPCDKPAGDTQAPSVPSGLKAVAVGNTQVDLTWQASNDNIGVSGYTIYRNNSAIATVSGSTPGYHDTAVLPNIPYTYAVDAFDAAGNHSPRSAGVNVLRRTYLPELYRGDGP